jgi:hypothetical protein
MIKKTLLYMVTMVATVVSTSCQEKKEQPIVQYVVQPEIELGKTADFYITFKVKPDSVWTDTDHIDGLELTNGLSEVMSHIDENSFYTYVKPNRLGKINFPVLNVSIKGKQYKTAPFSVNVVEKLNVDQDAVKIELKTDKMVYGLKDTIKISLYQYSKFTQTSRKSISKKAAITGKGNEIKISTEQGPDDIAGIAGFEKYVDQHFEMEDFDWDPFQSRKIVENIDGINYLKTLIFSASLLPKNKGEFKIGPSEFNYLVFKSNTDYFARLVPNEDGKYRVTEGGATKLKIASKPVTFEVK